MGRAARVLFFSYPSSFQNVGGGEVLLLKVKEYLEKAGAETRLFDMWNDRVENYDVLHVFGSVKDCLGLVRVARSRGVKIAITPLFWSSWKRAFFTYGTPREKATLAARHAVKLAAPRFPSSRRELMRLSDVVFPNSEIEKKQITRLFALPASRMTVVPNGVDRKFLSADPALFRARFGATPFILGVGRVEPRKNQLNLIRAARRMGAKRLVLIGSPVSGYESYWRECRKEGASFTDFIPALAHDDPLLASAYAACDLFALQGWFETPGLAALEAVLAGAPVAVTEGGATREYFEDDCPYLDPASPPQMARAMGEALRKGPSARLKERVLERFTWERIAEATLRAYKEILAR